MPAGQMMQGMPEQCRTMMQSMPQNCMSMMQEMMRGEMRQGGMSGGMMGGGMHGGMMGRGMQAPASAFGATKGYMEAANKMYGPMMDGLQADDPDVAFVRAIIAQRQGAIEFAKVRVQFGKDEQTVNGRTTSFATSKPRSTTWRPGSSNEASDRRKSKIAAEKRAPPRIDLLVAQS